MTTKQTFSGNSQGINDQTMSTILQIIQLQNLQNMRNNNKIGNENNGDSDSEKVKTETNMGDEEIENISTGKAYNAIYIYRVH